MTQQEKQLLFEFLCAGLPYGIIVKVINKSLNKNYPDNLKLVCAIASEDEEEHFETDGDEIVYVSDIRPYLRPMSSMTQEEENEFKSLSNHCITTSVGFAYIEAKTLIDWLIANKFDYCGFIENGLAIEAPENMYKTK